MIGLMRELRLVPLVVLAAASLLALKAFGLVTGGSYSLGRPQPAQAETALEPVPSPVDPDGRHVPFAPAMHQPVGTQVLRAASQSEMQEILGYPDYTASAGPQSGDKNTGSAARSDGPPDPRIRPVDMSPRAVVTPVAIDIDHPPVSAGERAVLESLNQRRQELEARARELDMRESLLKASEQKIEARLLEIKELEAKINVAIQKRDDAEAGRFKALIIMYENMRAKDAAKIFDRLDLRILIEVAAQINPRRMSDIMAQMSPDAAERLTSEIASRSGAIDKRPPTNDLPKIEGRPSGT